MHADKYRRKPYLVAIARRTAIEKSGIKPGDKVTYPYTNPERQQEYTFVKVTQGGNMQIKPVIPGRTIQVGPGYVIFQGKVIHPYWEKKTES